MASTVVGMYVVVCYCMYEVLHKLVEFTKIQHKLAESEKEIADRKSREKNIILFKADEPDTNLIEERVKSDKEFVGKILNEMLDGRKCSHFLANYNSFFKLIFKQSRV